MRKNHDTEEQFVFALKQAELGTAVAGVCRKMGVSEATFFRWKLKYAGLGPSELRQLQEENTKLKRLVAHLSLDKAIPLSPHQPFGRHNPNHSDDGTIYLDTAAADGATSTQNHSGAFNCNPAGQC
jgi:putative transposase